MAEKKTQPREYWLRRHKWPIVLVGAIAFAFVVVQAAKYYVDVDRYRTHVTSFIEERTGMTVTIDRLGLALLPQPIVTAHGVTLDDGDLRIQCRQVRAAARWKGLAGREVHVTGVTLAGLEVNLPQDFADVANRIGVIRDRANTHKKPVPSWRISVDRIRGHSAQVSMQGIHRPVFEGGFEARNVLSDSVPIGVAASLPFLGEPARLEAEIVAQIDRGADPAIVPTGWITVRDVDPREAFGRDAMPPLVFEMRADFAHVTSEAIGMEVTGEAIAASDAPELVRAAAGPFTATLWLRDSDIIVNDLLLQAPGLTLAADATRAADGALACEIQSARMHGGALAAVYAMVNSETLELVPQDEAVITATSVLAGFEADGSLRLARGEIAFEGVTPTLPDGSRPLGDVRGKVHLHEGMVHIDEITGAGMALRGTVVPDLERAAAAVKLTGALTLSPGMLQAFAKNDAIRDLSGRVTLDRVTGTFQQGHAMPDDLQIDGALDNARAVVAMGGIEDTLTSVSGKFRALPGAITIDASCQSVLLGPLALSAHVVPGEQRITGVVNADLARLNLPFPDDETAQSAVRSVALAYGASDFEIDVAWPREQGAPGSVRIVRRGAPALSAVLALVRDKGAIAAGAVEASADVPLPALRELLPDMVQAEGIAAVRATLPAGQQRMEAHVDLTEATLLAGDYVHKKPGDPARVDVLALPVEDEWRLATATLHYGGERVTARFADGRFVSEFDLDVAAFQNLFAEDIRARGNARGMLKTNPLEADIVLRECALGLSESLQFESVSGRLAYAYETPRIEDLAVHGLNSDFTMTLHEEPGPIWKGTVRGNRLDVDAVTAALEQFTGKNTTAGDSAEAPRHGHSLPGLDLDIELASVFYRKTRINDVRAAVNGRDGVYDVRHLVLAPGAGRVTGNAQVRMASGEAPSSVLMDLSFWDVDLSLVDGLAFAEPRGLKGLTSGTMNLDAPFGSGINPTHGATGSVAFVSRNGTLGSMGIATQILTVLRATEIVRLRVPSLRDEGLAFDTCEAKALLESGFMTIEDLTLKSPTLAMAAKGTIDFPRDVTDMQVDVHFLQMATQVLDIVRLGDVADQIRKQSSYRLSVSGPPTQPKVAIQGLTTGEGLGGPVADTARDAARTGQQTVVDVLQGSANILRGILGGGNAEKPQQTQQPPAQSPEPAP